MVFVIVAFHGFIVFHGFAVVSFFTVIFITVIEALPVTFISVTNNAEMISLGTFLCSPEATFFYSFGSSFQDEFLICWSKGIHMPVILGPCYRTGCRKGCLAMWTLPRPKVQVSLSLAGAGYFSSFCFVLSSCL